MSPSPRDDVAGDHPTLDVVPEESSGTSFTPETTFGEVTFRPHHDTHSPRNSPRSSVSIDDRGVRHKGSKRFHRIRHDVRRWLNMHAENHQAALRRPALVAGMVATPADEKISMREELPDEVDLIAEADSDFYGSPRRLFVVCLTDSREVEEDTGEDGNSPSRRTTHRSHMMNTGAECRMAPAGQLMMLEEALENSIGKIPGRRPADGPWLWPLHDTGVSRAVAALEEEMVFGAVGAEHSWHMTNMASWKRILYMLRIYTLLGGGPYIDVVRNQYGLGTAFNFAWSQVYTQQLWILVGVCLVWLVLLVITAGNPVTFDEETSSFWYTVNYPQSTSRIGWEIGKVGVLLWGVNVACPWRHMMSMFSQPRRTLVTRPSRRLVPSPEPNPDFVEETGLLHILMRWLKLILLGGPLFLGFVIMVQVTVVGCANVIVYLVYTWGDCIRLGCRDPTEKHGVWGWLAEVSMDVLLAILFEAFFALARVLAKFIVNLRNYRYEEDRLFMIEILTFVLAAIERVGVFGVMALAFVPQWLEPSKDQKINVNIDCTDLFLGENSMWCLNRKLPLEQRRIIFGKSMKGPFMVAPYVGILVKVIVPLAADLLDRITRRCYCWFCCACCSVFRALVRFIALIFVFDCETVGCLRVVFRGFPCKEPRLVSSLPRVSVKHKKLQLPCRPFSPSSASPGLDGMCASPNVNLGAGFENLPVVTSSELSPDCVLPDTPRGDRMWSLDPRGNAARQLELAMGATIADLDAGPDPFEDTSTLAPVVPVARELPRGFTTATPRIGEHAGDPGLTLESIDMEAGEAGGLFPTLPISRRIPTNHPGYEDQGLGLSPSPDGKIDFTVDRPVVFECDDNVEEIEDENETTDIELFMERFLGQAVQQGVRKPFEAADELMEMKMNFIWIMFFLPVMPIGIFPTVFARLIEVKTDLTKMLFIRRRTFPDEDRLYRMTQQALVRLSVCASLGWSVGLSLITYNDDLWRWGFGKMFTSSSIAVWMVISVFVAFAYKASRNYFCACRPALVPRSRARGQTPPDRRPSPPGCISFRRG